MHQGYEKPSRQSEFWRRPDFSRSRSVRSFAPTDHELMILLLSSASALARLPAFLRTLSRVCSSLGLASANNLAISAECLRKIGTIRSLPFFVSADTAPSGHRGFPPGSLAPFRASDRHADGTRREVKLSALWCSQAAVLCAEALPARLCQKCAFPRFPYTASRRPPRGLSSK